MCDFGLTQEAITLTIFCSCALISGKLSALIFEEAWEHHGRGLHPKRLGGSCGFPVILMDGNTNIGCQTRPIPK
jgi:hypothetical protein